MPFVHRHGFARQRRFVNTQRMHLQQPEVGRHRIPGLQQHDIPGYKFCRINADRKSVADDLRLQAGHPLQRIQCPLRPVFLIETQEGIEYHDDENDHRIGQIAQQS